MADSTYAPVTRPGGVTLVVVLMWIGGILEIIGGVVYLWLSFNPQQVPTALTGEEGVDLITASAESGASLRMILLWIGILSIIFGVITLLLASGLKNGSNGVRIFVTILIVLQLLFNAYEMASIKSNPLWVSMLTIIVWLIALGLLWSSRASAFFKQVR